MKTICILQDEVYIYLTKQECWDSGTLAATDKGVVTRREVGKRDKGIKRDLTPYFTLPTLISRHIELENKYLHPLNQEAWKKVLDNKNL